IQQSPLWLVTFTQSSRGPWHVTTINTKRGPYSVQYILRAMKTSQETAESLDHLAEKARLGLAWVKLENLKYEPPLGRPSIPLQSRKIGALLDKFRGLGCFPNVQRNRIQAKISPSVLAQALEISRVTIEDLQDPGSLRKLEFPKGVVLTHIHGQHRLEAARLHIYPHNVWWAVDLLNEEDLIPQFDVGEQNRNVESIPHSDGTVFRFLDTDGSWRQGFCSKRVEVDLKAIEKRPDLYKALAELRPFVGIWDAFSKGALPRINTLKIDHEIIHYLKWMLSKYLFMIDGDLEIAEIFDAETVEEIEARAPMVSLADREHILERFCEEKPIFSQVGDGATRARLQRNVLAINGLIPSMKTFLADTLYLGDCLLAMKILIDPTTRQIRDSLRHMWHGFPTSYIVLEYADGLTQEANFVMEEEDQFQIAYIQLWMFAMRNYPRLTSLVPKTDSNHKVLSTGPDPEWQRKFAVTAKALGFKSTAIDRLLEEDPDLANVRDMLSKARPPDKFMYDVQAETHSHCELLRRIQETRTQLGQDTTPVWTTEASKVQKNRRYGRPFERALEECKPYFFLHNMFGGPPPSNGRYFTDLFVKRSMLQFFFQIPVLPVALPLRRSIDLEIMVERDNLSRRRLREDGVIKQHNTAAEQATAWRQLEDENVINKERLSKAENVLAGHLEQIRDYEERVVELQKWKIEQSQQYSDSTRQSKEMIKGLKRTIENYASASKTQVAREREMEDALRVTEYESESNKQKSVVASLRRDLAAKSQLLEAFQLSIGKPRQEEIIAAKLANKITDLELNIQTQNTELKTYERGATIMRMINARIKDTRKIVEKMSSAIKGQLQLEPDSQGSDCELQSKELSAVGEQFNEIDDLEKSIRNFITLYSQHNLGHNENGWQTQVPREQLAIKDGTGAGVDTGTPDLEQMLVLVSRREGVVDGLRSKLANARESHRLKAERVVWLEGELRAACDSTQRDETAAMANLRVELSTVKTEAERVYILEADRAESLRQQLAEQVTIAHNTGQISRGYQERINELESRSEEKTEELRNYKKIAAIKGKTLNMIRAKIKETRKGVEKMSTVFIGRLQDQQTYSDNGDLDLASIDSDEFPPEDLPAAEQFDEIEDLKKSIWNFVTMCSQSNLPHNEKEWQTQVPRERLAIEDITGPGVDIGTPDLEQMLVLVSRRAEDLKQEHRTVLDLRAELYEVKTTAESQRLRAERVEFLEEELAEVRGQLREQEATGKRLKTADDATQRNINDLQRKLDTVEAEKKNLLLDGNRAISQLKEQARGDEKDLRASLQTTKNVQAELDREREVLKELRKEARKLWKEGKLSKETLEASQRQVLDLKRELEETRNREPAILRPEDERIRSLKEQLFETNRLIGLEEEKAKLEAGKKRIRAARDESKALNIQDQGDLVQQEADVEGNLLRVKEQMVESKLNILIYAKHKLRLENSRTERQAAVEYVHLKDLEKRFEKLHGQMIYCFVNKTMTMVELRNYKNFLANPGSLADHGEFFYCDHFQPLKRQHGPVRAPETPRSKAREVARPYAKPKKPRQ
ncbi:hypothetical protein V491_08178, partial [Pseudogymnoascus sp. VKM F-3775]